MTGYATTSVTATGSANAPQSRQLRREQTRQTQNRQLCGLHRPQRRYPLALSHCTKQCPRVFPNGIDRCVLYAREHHGPCACQKWTKCPVVSRKTGVSTGDPFHSLPGTKLECILEPAATSSLDSYSQGHFLIGRFLYAATVSSSRCLVYFLVQRSHMRTNRISFPSQKRNCTSGCRNRGTWCFAGPL